MKIVYTSAHWTVSEVSSSKSYGEIPEWNLRATKLEQQEGQKERKRKREEREREQATNASD